MMSVDQPLDKRNNNSEKRGETKTLPCNLEDLRMKFLAENPQVSISYTSFMRLRPFYVVHPKVNMRDTTACKLCTNGELLATKLTWATWAS